AHTLKARFLLHTVEASGSKATVYGNVITEATAGIASPANDLTAYHSATVSERNIWYQFQLTTFGQDVVAGKTLADIMKARNDPRLPDYFGINTPASSVWKAKTKYSGGICIRDSNNNVEVTVRDTLDSLSGPSEPTWPTVIGDTVRDSNTVWQNTGAPYGG